MAMWAPLVAISFRKRAIQTCPCQTVDRLIGFQSVITMFFFFLSI